MSGSTENRASKKPKTSRRNRLLNLTTAFRMLPLVERVVADLIDVQLRVEELLTELDGLDHCKRDLAWPERRRRYELQEEFERFEQHMSDLADELYHLGLALIDVDIGRVGFPTLVNNRPAYFSWWHGEEEIRYWHFADELKYRTIPIAWLQQEGIAVGDKQ